MEVANRSDSTVCIAEVLLAGSARGELLRLDRPISFWGGVDPATGRIIDPRHQQHDCSVAGRILAMERVVGSSSGSSVMMELLAVGKAPAGLITTEPDAILSLGVIVGREMGYGTIPVLVISPAEMLALPQWLELHSDGQITEQDAETNLPNNASA